MLDWLLRSSSLFFLEWKTLWVQGRGGVGPGGRASSQRVGWACSPGWGHLHRGKGQVAYVGAFLCFFVLTGDGLLGGCVARPMQNSLHPFSASAELRSWHSSDRVLQHPFLVCALDSRRFRDVRTLCDFCSSSTQPPLLWLSDLSLSFS